jgi:hypothetical protein
MGVSMNPTQWLGELYLFSWIGNGTKEIYKMWQERISYKKDAVA